MATTTKHTRRRICAVKAAARNAANAALQRLDPFFGPKTFSVPAKGGTMFVCDIAVTPNQLKQIVQVTQAAKFGIANPGVLCTASRLTTALSQLDVSEEQIEESIKR